jgi:hypothetical protein
LPLSASDLELRPAPAAAVPRGVIDTAAAPPEAPAEALASPIVCADVVWSVVAVTLPVASAAAVEVEDEEAEAEDCLSERWAAAKGVVRARPATTERRTRMVRRLYESGGGGERE